VVGSIIDLFGLDLAIPDHSHLRSPTKGLLLNN
jgi:hypothetical protein